MFSIKGLNKEVVLVFFCEIHEMLWTLFVVEKQNTNDRIRKPYFRNLSLSLGAVGLSGKPPNPSGLTSLSVKEGNFRCSPSFLLWLLLSGPEVYEAIVTNANKGDFVAGSISNEEPCKNAQVENSTSLGVLEEEEENYFTEYEPKEAHKYRNTI